MRHDAWWLNRSLTKVVTCFAIVSPRIAFEAGARKAIVLDRGAPTGTDSTALPRLAVITSSIAKQLDHQSSKATRALTETEFVVADGTIVGLASGDGRRLLRKIPFDDIRAATSGMIVAMTVKIVGLGLALVAQDRCRRVAFTHYAGDQIAPRHVRTGAWATRTVWHLFDKRSSFQRLAN